MQKRIRVILVIGIGLFILLVLVVFSFFYLRSKNNIPVVIPVTKESQSLELTKTLTDKGFILESAPFEDDGSIIASISGRSVIFSAKKDVNTQVKALQLITRSLKIDEVNPKEIDLRFDKVVLRY